MTYKKNNLRPIERCEGFFAFSFHLGRSPEKDTTHKKIRQEKTRNIQNQKKSKSLPIC
jgi:hypothetical protein